MTRLLVSVRNRSEALTALDAGADLIDIKEPLRGSLGYAGGATISEIARSVAGRAPTSAAFGELMHQSDTDDAWFDEAVSSIAFAKIGLANCALTRDWADRWQRFDRRLPEAIHRVAVAYADDAAKAPAFHEIVTQAVRLGCRAVLIDTFNKGSGPLLGHWSRSKVRSSILQIQAHGMLAVLAGGLTEVAIESLLPLAPDLFAVRGAACTAHDRTGLLCAEPIRRLKALLGGTDGAPQPAPFPPDLPCAKVFA
jgi:uncharacterized protein (UPF0264 family)